jgi:hypothetical protein
VSGRGAEEYGGPAPFSEPQSRALRDLARALRPVAYVNVHSGEWAMYVPWDHKKTLAEGQPADTEALLEALNTHCQCTRGAGGSASNYLAFGTSMDWMWEELRVNYSLTFELYGGNMEGKRGVDWRLGDVPVEKFGDVMAPVGARRSLASNFGCLPMFNPENEPSYRHVVASWVHNFFILADHVASHAPAASPPSPSPPLPLAVATDASLPRKLALPKGVAQATNGVTSAAQPSDVLNSAMRLPAEELVIVVLFLLALLFVLIRWGRRAPIIPWLGKRVGLDGVGLRDL